MNNVTFRFQISPVNIFSQLCVSFIRIIYCCFSSTVYKFGNFLFINLNSRDINRLQVLWKVGTFRNFDSSTKDNLNWEEETKKYVCVWLAFAYSSTRGWIDIFPISNWCKSLNVNACSKKRLSLIVWLN